MRQFFAEYSTAEFLEQAVPEISSPAAPAAAFGPLAFSLQHLCSVHSVHSVKNPFPSPQCCVEPPARSVLQPKVGYACLGLPPKKHFQPQRGCVSGLPVTLRRPSPAP